MLHGLLSATGATVGGPQRRDWLDVVCGPNDELTLVLMDLSTREPTSDELARRLLRTTARGLAERTPLHAVMLDLVRVLFDAPGAVLGATLLRVSAAAASCELTTAGMPPLACIHGSGHVSVHSTSAPSLTSATTVPPPVEVAPLIWGCTWMAASDGFTAGSAHPELVRRLALALQLPDRGLGLSRQAPQLLEPLLARRLPGHLVHDDATLLLLGADPETRLSPQRSSP